MAILLEVVEHIENNPKPDVHNASNDGEAHNWTRYYCLDIKEMQKESWRKDMSGRPNSERQGSQQFTK